MEKNTLEGKVAAELHEIASDLGIEGHKGLKKADLIDRILTHANGAQAPSGAEASVQEPAERGGNGEDGARVDMRERSGSERS
ncbi:MAG: Rho termination factor N-terminal domain-containing protein, partial [Actinomycetota bacterium]